MCPAIVAGAWLALYVHHGSRKGLLGAPVHELTVCVNGVEALRTTDLPFPKALGAAPLAVCRMGEGLEGDLGPVYWWGASGRGAPGGPGRVDR